jgi:hypothetical protein
VRTLRFRQRSSSLHAISRWCALTLALLAASPVTAPFSTFDLGTLKAGNTLHRYGPVEGSSIGSSIADAVFFLAPVGAMTEDLKNLAWAPTVSSLFASSVRGSRGFFANASSQHAPFSLVTSAVLRV